MSGKSDEESGFDQPLTEAVRVLTVLLRKTSLLEGRFVIQRLLGSGGMGVVYRATDTERNAEVALKMLTSVDAGRIYRLKQEFRSLADVVHPNLVGLHELFCDQNRWFFTMDLVPGSTLLSKTGEELDEQRLRSNFAQLATGIQAIHDAGKLHRDLKPSNVMLTPEGRVVILDFGLASDQHLGGAGQTVLDDNISGTPLYMAPEQAASRPATPASDWYAFGTILFEALTGRPPFEGKGHAVLMRKQHQDAPSPSSFLKRIPDDLERLCVQLLHRDPKARPGWQQIMQVLGPASELPESLMPQERAPFVGRIDELEALHQAFEDTDEGSPVAVFVHGVSGVGKTTLVEYFLDGLRRQERAVVLTGRCYERESVPFKTCDSLIDALSRHMRQLPPVRAGSLLPRQVHAIAQLFPGFRRLEFIRRLRQRRPLPLDPNELRRVAFEAFKELLANMAAQEPLVLFVDDLQWSDLDGAKLLSSVLSRPDPPALLLIGAYRSEDVETSLGLSALRDRIVEFEAAEVREIALGELSEQESQHLARDLLPASIQDRAAHIAREAQGSPFLIEELSRFASTTQDHAEQVGLKDAIKRRLAMLTESEREVLEAICVSARPIEPGLLRAVTHRDDVTAPLRRLQADHLARRTASGRRGRVRTYHDRIRESVIAAMDDVQLKSWHRKLAQSIEASENPDLIALTEHLLGAGDLLKAGTCACKAAAHAADTLAFENAARLYRMALELNPGDREHQRELQTKLATALANAGRGAEAAPVFIQAADGASLENALELRVEAARNWMTTGHMAEGMRELENVLKTVGLKLHSRPSGSMLDLVTNRLRVKLHGLDAGQRTTRQSVKTSLLKLRACRTATNGLYFADTLQSAAFSSRFLGLALKSGSIEDIALGLAIEATYLSAEGTRNRSVAERYLNRAEQLSQRVDDPEVSATLQYAKGVAAYYLGEPLRALEHLRLAESIVNQKCTGFVFVHNAAKYYLGVCYCNLGLWRELAQRWDAWIREAQDRNDLQLLTVQQTWPMGVCRWLAGDQVDKARETLSKGTAQWPWQSFDMHRWNAGISESFLHLYVGDYGEAFSVLEELSKRFFSSMLQRGQIGRVVNSYCLANAALGLASITQDRKRLLKIAAEQANKLAREDFPLTDAFVPYIRGGLSYLTGDEDAAARLLRESVAAFEGIGFKLYAAATNRQLGRLLGGDEGRALVAEADETMKKEGIKKPERGAAVMAPGFPD